MGETLSQLGPLMRWHVTGTYVPGCVCVSFTPGKEAYSMLQTRELLSFQRSGDQCRYQYSPWVDVPVAFDQEVVARLAE